MARFAPLTQPLNPSIGCSSRVTEHPDGHLSSIPYGLSHESSTASVDQDSSAMIPYALGLYPVERDLIR